jgi:hypothetical protein
VFTSDTQQPLNYVPDFERENYLQALHTSLEKKIAFFSLPDTEIKKLVSACRDIETSCIVGFRTGVITDYKPEDIYNFCVAIEENYSPQITHFEAWHSKTIKDLKIDKAEVLFGLVGALTKSEGNEFSASVDMAGIKACFNHITKPINGGTFTQSWVLRMVLQILQPFKNHPYAYPAVVQSVFLESRKKNVRGLLHPNLAAIRHKSLIDETLEPYVGLTAGALRTEDITPLLTLGYDIMEESLLRVDDLLKQVYRQKVSYAKKEPRIRNLLNFLYSEGMEYLEPHMGEFNERQQQIIKYLFAKRYLGTKELTLDFRCDRKTIQRDFVKLLSSEVVKSTGNGSALKYCINLKNNGYDMLEIHSTSVRKREDYQESLFGEEIWETKKA